MKEELDPDQARQLQEYLDESAKPEDKALDDYWEFYSTLIEKADLPKDWEAIQESADEFINQYPLDIRKYITDNLDVWIKDLPENARKVETERLAGLEDGTWWDDYRGETPKKRTWPTTPQPKTETFSRPREQSGAKTGRAEYPNPFR